MRVALNPAGKPILFLVGLCSLPLAAQDQPAVAFASLLGGAGTDDCDAVAVDAAGNTFLGCHLSSVDIPGSDKFPFSLAGNMDAFVIKLDAGDASVAYIAHWGGADWDAIQGLTTDAEGSVYAVGVSNSNDFPVSTSAAQGAFGGDSEIFLTKVDPSGKIVWTRFFGGDGDEDSQASDIALDKQGNILITGYGPDHFH